MDIIRMWGIMSGEYRVSKVSTTLIFLKNESNPVCARGISTFLKNTDSEIGRILKSPKKKGHKGQVDEIYLRKLQGKATWTS